MGIRVKATKAWAALHEDGSIRVNNIRMMSEGNHMVRVRIMGLAQDKARTTRIRELEDELKRKTDALRSIAKCGREEPKGICRTCIAIATDALPRPAKGKRK